MGLRSAALMHTVLRALPGTNTTLSKSLQAALSYENVPTSSGLPAGHNDSTARPSAQRAAYSPCPGPEPCTGNCGACTAAARLAVVSLRGAADSSNRHARLGRRRRL